MIWIVNDGHERLHIWMGIGKNLADQLHNIILLRLININHSGVIRLKSQCVYWSLQAHEFKLAFNFLLALTFNPKDSFMQAGFDQKLLFLLYVMRACFSPKCWLEVTNGTS